MHVTFAKECNVKRHMTRPHTGVTENSMGLSQKHDDTDEFFRQVKNPQETTTVLCQMRVYRKMKNSYHETQKWRLLTTVQLVEGMETRVKKQSTKQDLMMGRVSSNKNDPFLPRKTFINR